MNVQVILHQINYILERTSQNHPLYSDLLIIKNECFTESYKKPHLELRSGEILLTNSKLIEIDDIKYKTKRIGIVAYDNHNNILQYMIPVFIQLSEYIEAQHEYNKVQF